MIETYPANNFFYDDGEFSVDASLLELPVGQMLEQIKIQGKNETVKFTFDHTYRDEDNDVVYWEYTGQDSKLNQYALKVYND